MNILDIIAILIEREDLDLPRGSVGTIIEKLDNSHFEVKFSNENGETIAQTAFHENDLIVLHYSKAVA